MSDVAEGTGPGPDAEPKPPSRERARLAVRNRQTAALVYRSDEWAVKKAAVEALATVRGWGYGELDADDLDEVMRLLVGTVVADGGKRVSVHLADQDRSVLVLVLSHRVAGGRGEQHLLGDLATVPSVHTCGSDIGEDGRRVWALLNAHPRPRRTGRVA
ncbi:hypothetical protein [Streptomyces sp. BR123]|uniref:hypothetical protein n=1 Tax=Streptomyces sp. BR123 TaxID=2749828 RepID=UPI00211ACCE3|nr:hypothetical protein [Streptomyces sp. BR123]